MDQYVLGRRDIRLMDMVVKGWLRWRMMGFGEETQGAHAGLEIKF